MSMLLTKGFQEIEQECSHYKFPLESRDVRQPKLVNTSLFVCSAYKSSVKGAPSRPF